jgi:hypothetical protein
MAMFPNKLATRCPAMVAGALALLLAPELRAQEAAPPPPPAPAVEAAPAPTPPPPPPAPVALPAATVAPNEPAAVLTEKKEEKVQHKKMDPPAIWFRLNNAAQNASNPKKLNGFSLGSEVDVLFSGEVHEYVAWQADFVATFGNQQSDASQKMTGSAAVLDLIGKFNLHESLNLWVGRMLVPSDRSNFSGPWFMSAWNYPGAYAGGAFVGPRQGPFGRNDGATLWGQFLGGYIKYYLSAFDLHDAAASALISGRLNLTLFNPEPGYYHSSTYYGGKDIVALGLSGQYKKNGSVDSTPMSTAKENYSEFSADLLAEKKFGAAGVGTFEGGYYKFNGKYEAAKDDFYLLGSYLIPAVVGIGKFQPLVRYQQATPQSGSNWSAFDAGIGYVVDEYAMRLALNFQTAKANGITANQIQLGIQIQK